MKTYARLFTILIVAGIGFSGVEMRADPPAKCAAESKNPLAARPIPAPIAASSEKQYRRFMPGTRITLKPRKAKYFLGENILLDYAVFYDGEGRLKVGTACGLGSPDCRVMAIDQTRTRAPDSTRPFHCNGSSIGYVTRNASFIYTIPLAYYCRIEKAGVYRVRAAHDLGWPESDSSEWRWPRLVPEDDPRWADTTIEISMPDSSQARRIVEKMLGDRTDVGNFRDVCGAIELPDYADFTCLQYPVYLPILEDLAAGKNDDKRALTGIAHMPTREATGALFRLLEGADPDRVRRITSALCDRLPDPQGVKRPGRANPIEAQDADPQLAKRAWRGDFAAPARRLAGKLLNEQEPTSLRCGAYILEAVGTREDMPGLVAAVSKTVPVVEKAKPTKYLGEIGPVRKACMDLVYATEALAARGVEPTADPRTPGEIIHFVLAVKQRKEFRPAGWEKRCADWARQESSYVREVVLFNAPRPLPESLLGFYQIGVRTLIATTRQGSVFHDAAQCALDMKIPKDEVLGMLADRLDSKEGYADLKMCLLDLLEGDMNDHLCAAGAPFPGEEKAAAVKAAWKRFLKEHAQSIREGELFDLDDTEIMREMLR